MYVRIKKQVMTTVKHDPLAETHPCLVALEGVHSHSLDTAEALRLLPMTSPTKHNLESLWRYMHDLNNDTLHVHVKFR